MPTALTQTNLPKLAHRGKVRDIYDAGDVLLFVATDRISAFDVVLPNGIPEKGVVLNELSRFWFERTRHVVPNHYLAMGTDTAKVSKYFPALPHEVARRAMLVKKVKPVLVECVVRGYLAGSAWSEYKKSGMIGGMPAPKGLKESQRLEQPLFTPTTKAQVGHDQNILMGEVERLAGKELAAELKRLTLAVYNWGHEYALTKGVIIADTKFEFGMDGATVYLIDEVLTPDSSRFWDSKKYEAGRAQEPMDKQFVRDWLNQSGWNKEPPSPSLPPEIVEQTVKTYKDVYHRLTGQALG
ncbi:MAG: phosphoribosylaminoimidazolesuccinocarboxamide synthase [Dehalococcoidia bacterium]|nr:phosphoribosylaminoimidazolesuccinocarboxamide synthase [Dehalococcoidia bacterium]